MSEFRFKTVLSNLQKGGKPCYFCIPLNNGTEYLKDSYEEIGKLINMSKPFAKTASGICLDAMVEQALQGARVETENISMYVTCRGGFASTTDKWDPNRNSLHLVIQLKGELKKKLESMTFVNTTEGVVVTFYSAGDEVYNTDGVIAGTAGTTIKLAGEGFNFDASKDDEGVWFLDAEKTIVAKLSVSAKTDQTIDCSPSAALALGEGYIMVASRNGESDKGVACAYRKVTVEGPKA